MLLALASPHDPCAGDECAYLALAGRILDGHGLTPSNGWLWAPGFPYLIAACQALFGDPWAVRWLQIAVAGATTLLLASLGRRIAGAPAGRVAAWSYALHPTFAFYAGHLWTETFYTAALVGAVLGVAWCREGSVRRAVVPGALLAAATYFRGMAAWSLPLFAVAALWPAPGEARGRALGRGALLAAAAVLLVAPYSIHASRRFGGLIISDVTLGRMMYLGNNDFAPRTFDVGNYRRIWVRRPGDTARGRPRCDPRLGPVAYDACETRNGLAWIRAHPLRFVARVPERAAQMLNPNSFFTRELRRDRYAGLTPAGVTLLCVWIVLTTCVVMLAGSVGAWAFARGPTGLLLVGVGLYHLAVICALAGLTRYRVPWEALWLVFAGALAARPRETWRRLRARPWLGLGAAASVALLVPLLLWYLPAGFPALWRPAP